MGVSWRPKDCPRCGGDMFIEEDLDRRWHKQCLQCSYQVELKQIIPTEQQPVLVAKQ